MKDDLVAIIALVVNDETVMNITKTKTSIARKRPSQYIV